MTQMLLPERWLVQPKVVPMWTQQLDPDRRRMPSVAAERRISPRAASHLTMFAVAPYVDKGRLLTVSMNPPDDVGLRIIRFIVTAGDRRYWSWKATRANARGNVRNSLMWELGVVKQNLHRGLTPLLEDGVLEIDVDSTGKEFIRFTPLGKMIFAEVEWRWKLRSALPDLDRLAASYGWQELSLQIDRRMSVESYEYERRADIIHAAKEQLKDGVTEEPPVMFPKGWTR